MGNKKHKALAAHPQLLELPTSQLLDKFGSGGHKPGSGSAAALMGIVACKLLRTVITLTQGRKGYEDSVLQLNLVGTNVAENVEPYLVQAVQLDAKHFDLVIKARRARDKATDPLEKRRLDRKALQELQTATDIPLNIARRCISLADWGLSVFDLGFKSARGDSGVAISAAVSAASGALSIVYLNLTKFRTGKWSEEVRSEANELLRRSQDIHQGLFRKITSLQEERRDDPQLKMKI